MQIKQLLSEGKNKLIQDNIDDASMQARMVMQYVLEKPRELYNCKWRKGDRC